MTARAAGIARPARRLARSVARGAARISWLGPVLDPAYARYFNRATGNVRLFRGVFSDLASAARALPANRPVGYDNEASAYRVIGEWRKIYAYDYPIMYWLHRLLPDCKLLFDWGGNVGLKYFAYEPYLAYADDLQWCVCEVPAVARAGREIAAREGARAVRFTTTLEELADADVLLAAGSLHYIDDPFARLREATRLPKHLLLCKVPVYDRESAVTLSNMGTAICLYHLFNRDEFVRNVEALRYRLVDEWRTADGFCRIPFHPDHTIDSYAGFYFERCS